MPNHIVVGAIDFGTTFSGWALLFNHEFVSDPTKGFVKQWFSSSTTLVTEKTPTVVLIKPDGKTLEAFGYDAENRYEELLNDDEEEHGDYYYFQRFKMKLYKQLGEKMDLDMTLSDERGRILPAIDVFSLAIKYLVDDLHNVAKLRVSGGIEKSDVHWVITVPTIWTDSAKQFMRNAGERAGIVRNKLTIALEPEAASIFCRHLSVEKRHDSTGISIASFPVGTKYMVLDAGGGTIDVTVHEVHTSETVKEVKAASGGDWGGISVDRAFEELLIDIVGADFLKTFKQEQTEAWLDLGRAFEIKKRNINPDKDNNVIMKFPPGFRQLYESKCKRNLAEYGSSSKYGEKIQFVGDKMKCTADVFKRLFDTSLAKIVEHIESLVCDPNVCDIRAILMVGGFSNSPMLQQKMKLSFPSIDIIIPKEASSSIMKGALIIGHNPQYLSERILRHTYGVKTTTAFIEGKHPENKRLLTDLGHRCQGIFDKHARKDQVVKVGEPQAIRSYTPSYRNQTSLTFHVYASVLKDPVYTDVDCKHVGTIKVKLPDHDGDLKRSVKISITFSGTEIEVTGLDEKTGLKTEASLNFLG